MRDAMNRLAGVLGRRRRWVVAVWVLIVLAALPFAAKQTEHLTGGGFDVPGSQSQAVSQSLQDEFGEKVDGISVALQAAPDATLEERAAAVRRVRAEVAEVEEVTLTPAAALAGLRELKDTDFALLPLVSQQS